MAEERRARRIYVSGEVQGLGYRFFAANAAQRAGVSGYARNLDDGRVEVYAIGLTAQLDGFIDDLRRGPRHARVHRVEVDAAELLPELDSNFSIE
jgi:acylphosphatase